MQPVLQKNNNRCFSRLSHIKIAFWNVENLFDLLTEPWEIALDFDFAVEKGWSEENYVKGSFPITSE